MKLAFKSLWYDRWINLLTTLTIGAGLFILGVIVLFLFNAEGITKRLPERFSITVFLSNDISQSQIDNIETSLKNESIVQKVQYISKDDALRELRSSLKDAAFVLEGFEENPLFPSVIISLERAIFDRAKVDELIAEIVKLKGVEDVVYREKLLDSIEAVHRDVKAVSAGVILLFFTAIIFVCYSTVKILFYRRKEEIEIYKLLGATRVFIRSPFIIEASILGLFGGVWGCLGIYGLYRLIHRFVIHEFPFFLALTFPEELFGALPITGLALGIIGSAIALGRLKF
jgi:cell division transport system permease protein